MPMTMQRTSLLKISIACTLYAACSCFWLYFHWRHSPRLGPVVAPLDLIAGICLLFGAVMSCFGLAIIAKQRSKRAETH
jgi:hypothetical protein